MDDTTYSASRCPECGAVLSPSSPQGLCGACLLLAGTGSVTRLGSDDAPTVLRGEGRVTLDEPRPLEPNQLFGPYRIGRLLGRGGMGEVYEAEHIESGRRLALKILRGRLQHSEDRARFLQEGQLAASVSHPHTVYIFGSEEIGGLPIITMELLPGGTLKDRVTATGPLPIHDAVAAVLNVIGGLDAAHAAGILHRDIKPANCFTEVDGTVKVGDFGLSISTLARDVRQDLNGGGFQGTPQFAPPEQLRGEPLDVRADIYAVGATLYYLLTGQAPYDARDLRELVDKVTSAPVPSPRHLRPDVPQGLAQVVSSCLAKVPEARPSSYAALADRLRPFARPSARPAPPSLRLVAGLIDSVLVNLPVTTWNSIKGSTQTAAAPAGGFDVGIDASTWLVSIAYYAVLEGIWGASLGKRLLGLRLTSGTHAPGWSQIAKRLAVFHVPHLVFLIPFLMFGTEATRAFLQARVGWAVAAMAGTIGLVALLFSTARRHNGWAALHDLASGLRVVATTSVSHARTRTAPAPVVATAPPAPGLHYGPFVVTADVGRTGTGRLLIGFDPVLRRRVWIHAVGRDTPPIAAARRDTNRVGRAHWLAGRRSGDDNWDAFEAPDGAPWLDSSSRPHEWVTTRGWLLDLATELWESDRDGTTPPLSADRLWVRADGRLMVLDLPAPGAGDHHGAALTPVGLLALVAATGLQSGIVAGRPSAWPLSAREMLAAWQRPSPPSLGEARDALTRVSHAPAAVARWRRAIPIVLAAFPVALLIAAAAAALPALQQFVTQDRMEVATLLSALDGTPSPGSRLAEPGVREALERYLVQVHHETLTSDSFWNHPAMQGDLQRLRPGAITMAARRTEDAPRNLTELRASIAPELAEAERQFTDVIRPGLLRSGGLIAAILTTISLAFVMTCSLMGSLIVPGGVVTRLLGFAAVSADGREVTRARSLFRVLVAWLPVMIWLAVLGPSPIDTLSSWTVSPILGVAAVLGVMAAGAAFTIWQPTRGPHDHLARTWLVPR